jgi:hypothetical protein
MPPDEAASSTVVALARDGRAQTSTPVTATLRLTSRDLSFDVTDGDVAAFRCHGAMVWPRWLVSLVKPDWAIALMRQ